MNKFVKIAAAAAFAIIPVEALAVTANVTFGATVTHSCAITVNSNGTLAANAGFTQLSSTIGAGTSGSANIVATGNEFDVSVGAPTLTTTGSDTSANTLVSSYSTTGATSVSGTNADAARGLNNGTTAVTVNMSATKSGANVFEAGAYTGTVALTCE